MKFAKSLQKYFVLSDVGQIQIPIRASFKFVNNKNLNGVVWFFFVQSTIYFPLLKLNRKQKHGKLYVNREMTSNLAY